MSTMASQITCLAIVYSTVNSDQRKHQSSASLAFVRGIHRPVTRKMFPFDDVITIYWMFNIWPTEFLLEETWKIFSFLSSLQMCAIFHLTKHRLFQGQLSSTLFLLLMHDWHFSVVNFTNSNSIRVRWCVKWEKEHISHTLWIPWLLLTQRREEPGHQQLRYSHISPETCHSKQQYGSIRIRTFLTFDLYTITFLAHRKLRDCQRM